MKRPAEMMFAIPMPEDDSARPVVPMREAQIERLDELLAQARHQHMFQQGDLVHFPGGYGALTRVAKRKLVLMFWRYLDPDDPSDMLAMQATTANEISQYPRIDCMIVYYDGACFSFTAVSSELLAPGFMPIEDEPA